MRPDPNPIPIPPTPFELDRRAVLGGGLLLGAAWLLGGCSGGGERVSSPGRTSGGSPVVAGAGGLAPGVIPRSEWTSQRAVGSRAKTMGKVSRITVHHSATNTLGMLSRPATARMISSIRSQHVSRRDPDTGQHWADIGYHYIVDPSGRIWEGRPTWMQGAHVSRTNEGNLGIVLLGHFDQHQPTDEALRSLDAFVASQMRRYGVSIGRVYTHQELKPTACPGRNLQRYMVRTRASAGRLFAAAI